jgi:hypothetical protein
MSVVGTKFYHLPQALKTKSKGLLLQNTKAKGRFLDANVMIRSFSFCIYYCTAELMDLLLPFTRE